MGNNKNIPEGWLNYSPLGKPIPGTIIICFKVPLKEELSCSIPDSQRFTPSTLIRKVPNLVGIIDVTNTPRYYDNRVFKDKGILHEKIKCPGHVVPPAQVVDYFQRVMQRMWATAESAEKLVGVHCTHGINRTGYLVCRYLIECRGFHPEDAIRVFAESRGHGIERGNYLSDLRRLKPGHRSPNAIPHAEFLKMEEQRRACWNMDATNDSVKPRHNHHHNWRQAPYPSPMRPPRMMHNEHHYVDNDQRPWHHRSAPPFLPFPPRGGGWEANAWPPPSRHHHRDSPDAGHRGDYYGHHHHVARQHHHHHPLSNGGQNYRGSRYTSGSHY